MKEEQGNRPLPSDILEDAAEQFARSYDNGTCDGIAQDCFIAGAKWQMEQMMKEGNVILAEEDFDAEKEKSMEWGYNLCKEQMLKDALEASRNVYESWMGGTMDDVRRDMVELGKVLNARKEDER